MAKSIRSKIKRKHRAEFRATYGTVAYEANMANVSKKLQKCIEQQSMSEDTYEKLSNLLGSNTADALIEYDVKAEDLPGNDVNETIKLPVEGRGENRVVSRMTPSKRSKRRKHKFDTTTVKAGKQDCEPRKPRFFCQF
ncbi:hypothetical protein MPSEU_000374700 [Mayamaea pseudoterrestris]|nr:hypothetical protein MPSEU_000374700 [Mayamaea pseudoterrestris]